MRDRARPLYFGRFLQSDAAGPCVTEHSSRFRCASGFHRGTTKMNKTRAELVTMQQAIAAGHPPTPPSDGEFYWHPKMRLGLRLYNSGRGTWLVKYRNDRGLEKTHKIGDASVLNVSLAENAAKKVVGKVALGEDPVGDRQQKRARPTKTVGAL